ncbi:MAG: hypothetical protein PVG20_05500 [Thioalkalispiraceae bacterium]|jgi:hypothetical protein
MYNIKHAFPREFLNELVLNTIQNIQKGNMLIDQYHFVNYQFIQENIDTFKKVVLDCLVENGVEPDLRMDNLIYINDFAAVVNVDDYVTYKWHWDLIDRNLEPGACYNLWIPVFNEDDRVFYDNKPLMSVIPFDHEGPCDIYNVSPWKLMKVYEKDKVFNQQEVEWYNAHATGDDGILNGGEEVCEYIDLETKKLHFAPFSKYKQQHITLGDYGDCAVFCSRQYHKTGTSLFPRLGIAIKFAIRDKCILQDELVGDKPEFLTSSSEMGWLSLFISSLLNSGNNDIDAWKEHLEPMIKSKFNAEGISLKRKDLFYIVYYLCNCLASHGGEQLKPSQLTMLNEMEVFNPDNYIPPHQQ